MCALAACGGDEDDGAGMAREVGGQCVFTPGSYVMSYALTNPPSYPCNAMEAWNDEELTVQSDGTFVSPVAGQGCTDTARVATGCLVSFDRTCDVPIMNGRAVLQGDLQYDYAGGDGAVALNLQVYSGTTLLGTCAVNMEASIERR